MDFIQDFCLQHIKAPLVQVGRVESQFFSMGQRPEGLWSEAETAAPECWQRFYLIYLFAEIIIPMNKANGMIVTLRERTASAMTPDCLIKLLFHATPLDSRLYANMPSTIPSTNSMKNMSTRIGAITVGDHTKVM